MFDLKLTDGESIEKIDEDALLFNDKDNEKVVFIKTNKRIFFLIDGNKKSEFHQVLNITRGMQFLPDYEIILESDLTEVTEYINNGDFYTCKLNDGTVFDIKTSLEL